MGRFGIDDVFLPGNEYAGNVTDAIGLTNHSGERALAAQERAAREANATQRYMYDQTRADFQPWRETGQSALSGLAKGDFMNNLQMDPSYQFRLNEGMKALQNSAAARGNLNSGATLKALTRYGQDYASNEYQNAYSREYNRLSQLANFGQASTAQSAASGQNYANQVSQNQIGLGNAAAANEVAWANRLSNLLGQGMQAGATYYGYRASDERLKADIEPVSREDFAELKSVIRAVKYRYKDQKHGSGDFIGILAQDLEKSKIGKTLVVEDENGHKLIDLNRVAFLFLASLAEA